MNRADGAVWVVDDQAGPGVDFTTIQAAVDAADAGDTIVIGAGQYGEVGDVENKSHLEIRGVGQVTIKPPAGEHGFFVDECDNIVFRNLTIKDAGDKGFALSG